MPVDVTPVDAGRNKISRRVEVNASAETLFSLIADPRQHADIDGSATVLDVVSGPQRLAPDAKFTVRMKFHGLPYRITSRVTEYRTDRVLEWRHPLGHRWRWEFEAIDGQHTQVTETWDYSHSGAIGSLIYGWMGFLKTNSDSIEKTLAGLHRRFSAPPADGTAR